MTQLCDNVAEDSKWLDSADLRQGYQEVNAIENPTGMLRGSDALSLWFRYLEVPLEIRRQIVCEETGEQGKCMMIKLLTETPQFH